MASCFARRVFDESSANSIVRWLSLVFFEEDSGRHLQCSLCSSRCTHARIEHLVTDHALMPFLLLKTYPGLLGTMDFGPMVLGAVGAILKVKPSPGSRGGLSKHLLTCENLLV